MNRNFSIDAILARKPVEKRKQIITKDNCKFIRVFLQSSNLWRRFHNLGTEMIVTKSGRLVESIKLNCEIFIFLLVTL